MQYVNVRKLQLNSFPSRTSINATLRKVIPTSLQSQKTKRIIPLDLAILAKLPSYHNSYFPLLHFPLIFPLGLLYILRNLQQSKHSLLVTVIEAVAQRTAYIGQAEQSEWPAADIKSLFFPRPTWRPQEAKSLSIPPPKVPDQSKTSRLYSLTHQSLLFRINDPLICPSPPPLPNCHGCISEPSFSTLGVQPAPLEQLSVNTGLPSQTSPCP